MLPAVGLGLSVTEHSITVSLISDFISYKHLHIDCKILCFRCKQLYYNIFTWDKRHEVSSAYEIVRILGTHFWNFVWAWNFCQIFHQREPWTILRFSLRLILFENWTIKKEKTFCGFYNHINADIARCDEIHQMRVGSNTLNSFAKLK